MESHRSLESPVTCVFLSGCKRRSLYGKIQFLHFCGKGTVTSECHIVHIWNNNYFTPYKTVILFYAMPQGSMCNNLFITSLYIIFIILKKAKWHHYWRSWDISAMKGCFATIFYHFSSFNNNFIWCNYLKDCFAIFLVWII